MQEEYSRGEELAKAGEDDRINHIGLLSYNVGPPVIFFMEKLSAIYVLEPEDKAIP